MKSLDDPGVGVGGGRVCNFGGWEYWLKQREISAMIGKGVFAALRGRELQGGFGNAMSVTSGMASTRDAAGKRHAKTVLRSR